MATAMRLASLVGAVMADPSALATARGRVALAAAPVAVDFAPPLRLIDFEFARRSVEVFPIFCSDSGERYDLHQAAAVIPDQPGRVTVVSARHRGNVGNNHAALRASLQGTEAMAGPHPWGHGNGDVHQVTVLFADGRVVILEGTWAAIRRAAPDRETIEAWRAAGATDFPLPDFTTRGADVRWVPLDEVPRVIQMEHTSRSLPAY
jgi:hypothetical protein